MLDYSIKIFVKKILGERESTPSLFQRNIVKEYLQVLVLRFLYSKEDYRELVFYGGSCLRHCFSLPRLSEDLDFIDISKKVSPERLALEIKAYFEKKTGLKVTTKTQKFRITLKFPILYELNLAEPPESDWLFLKIEIYKEFDFCKAYKIEVIPLFKFGEAVLLRTFDLPTLMATKIRAILHRKWERTDRKGKVLARVKGRDYYDLMWYLDKGVEPNLRCTEGIRNKSDLRKMLLEQVRKVDSQSLKYDLESLMEDRDFLDDLGDNFKEILARQIEKL
ncbi:MAG: nucleotidyl transferase AbiEii/AbiGii toxin family protein [Candidatus Aminicenantes bacterium]|nr:nucleotidyl transferase AbiEii/AbiGii toxin family protein [Candidatus Aminicenantes bacterium]